MLQVGFWDDFVAVIAGSIHCVPSPGVAANWTGVVEAGEALEVVTAFKNRHETTTLPRNRSSAKLRSVVRNHPEKV